MKFRLTPAQQADLDLIESIMLRADYQLMYAAAVTTTGYYINEAGADCDINSLEEDACDFSNELGEV